MPKTEKVVNDIETNEKVHDDLVKTVLDFLLLRARFIYGYKEIFHYLFKCKCLTRHFR